MIKIGCCGFPVGREKYYRELRLVEIQRTFYKLPLLKTAEKWRQQAADDFEFTLKAWQGVTHLASSPTYRKARIDIPEGKQRNLGHFQPTDEVHRAWQDTLRIAGALRASVIVVQCPPRFGETKENLKNLLQFFRNVSLEGFKVAVEFRAPWKDQTITGICKEFGLIHCVDPFKEEPHWGEIRYYRLHGSPPGKRMYHYKYQPADFEFLNGKIEADLRSKRTVYCLFNNLSMWEDARHEAHLLSNTLLVRRGQAPSRKDDGSAQGRS
jgi:uncharacterized protein YecE (DUF72 family)